MECLSNIYENTEEFLCAFSFRRHVKRHLSSLFFEVEENFDYLLNEETMKKLSEFESKHNRLEGIYNTGFVKDDKVVSGDIVAAMKRATKIAEIKNLRKQLEAQEEVLEKEIAEEKGSEKVKKLLSRKDIAPKMVDSLPQKRGADSDAKALPNKRKKMKQGNLQSFGFFKAKK